MRRLESSWRRLELQHASAMETLDSLEKAALELDAPADLERIGALRGLAARLDRALEAAASGERSDWNAWVAGETALIELRFEIRGLVAASGHLRQAFLGSVRDRIRRIEEEISGLLARSDRFRPRTRVAISQDVQRLRRGLAGLREDALRVAKEGVGADETALRGIGHAWSAIEWNVEETKRRYARPRRRAGGGSAAGPPAL